MKSPFARHCNSCHLKKYIIKNHSWILLNGQVSRLQEMLEAKQLQLREVLSGGGEGKTGPTPEERQLEQQREEYGRRGIRYYIQDSLAQQSSCWVILYTTVVYLFPTEGGYSSLPYMYTLTLSLCGTD